MKAYLNPNSIADGEGLFDFKGFLVRIGERAGFIHDYSWGIRKGPQAQAIRTKSRQLQFAGLASDRAQSRGAIPDHLVKFRKPGLNAVPINSRSQVSRDDWIQFAEYCWDDIRETDTLNIDGTKGPEDTKHICALQRGLIERAVKLFSNPGELVFSPFAGIGSEGFVSLKLGRKFLGVELKSEYYRKAIENCERAVRLRQESQKTLFDGVTP